MSEVTKPILLDETGQSIVTKLDAIKDAITNKLPAGDPVRITVVTPPTKTEYVIGETVDLTGMVVSAIFSNNALIDITDQCTFTPAEGTIAAGDKITASWTWLPTGQTFTAITPIEVEYVTWENGTNAQIEAMLQAHYADLINIYDYWTVGDDRVFLIDELESYGTGQTYNDVQEHFVLLNAGGKELKTPINGHTECAFIIGCKEPVGYATYLIDPSVSIKNNYDSYRYTYSSAGYWNNCGLRDWCNTTFKNALEYTTLFKQFKNETGKTPFEDADEIVVSEDYFSIPSEKEYFGDNNFAYSEDPQYDASQIIQKISAAEHNLSQFEYYKNTANRRTQINTRTVSFRRVYDYGTETYVMNPSVVMIANQVTNRSSTPTDLGYGIQLYGVI